MLPAGSNNLNKVTFNYGAAAYLTVRSPSCLSSLQSAVIPASGPVTEEEEKTQRPVHLLRLSQEPQLYHLHSGVGVSLQHKERREEGDETITDGRGGWVWEDGC